MKLKFIQFSKILCLSILTSALAISTPAADSLRKGKFNIDLSISALGEYNDNIFWSESDEQCDHIYTLKPAVDFVYASSPENSIKLGYKVDFVTYTEYSDNDYEKQDAHFDWVYNSPAGLYFKLNDNYIDTKDPYGPWNEYGQGVPTQRWNNTLSAAIGFNFAYRMGIEGSYRNFIERYDRRFDQWEDLDDNTYGLSLLFGITPKTRLFCQYQLRELIYPGQNDGLEPATGPPAWNSDTSQDNNQHLYYVGARFSPRSKLSGEFKIGYADIQHTNDTDKNGVAYEDQGTWVAETRLEYRMRERTLFSFDLKRSYKTTPSQTMGSQGYLDTLVRVGIEQKMKHRLKATLDLGWNTQDYQETEYREVEKLFHIFRINAGLSYDMNQWLNTGLRYWFNQKEATKDAWETEEYTINAIELAITVGF